TQNFSASTPLRTGSDSNSFSSECTADFASCTLNSTTRPPLCRANAAAYFSAACAFADKSVGKRMFLNGNTSPPYHGSLRTIHRTVGAALCGRPWFVYRFKKQRPRVWRTLIKATGGHGGPPLQYVPQRST